MGQDNEVDHEALVKQAETVLEAVKATMYYPVAHGEAARLQEMLEDAADELPDSDE
jgi:hypothetical protein